MTKMWNGTAIGALALAGALTMSTAANTQDVTLRSSDGTVNMTGEFIDFRDNAYVISSHIHGCGILAIAKGDKARRIVGGEGILFSCGDGFDTGLHKSLESAF